MSLKVSPHTQTSPVGRKHTRRFSLRRVGLWILVSIAALVLLVRFVGGPIAKDAINKKLESMPDFRGHVETLKIALWRGGIEINQFTLHDRKRPDDLPIVKVEEIDLRWSWTALFQGRLGGAMTVDRAELNMVQTEVPTKEDKEAAKRRLQEIRSRVEPWRKALEETIPLELSRFEINDSKIHFIDRAHQPNSTVGLDQIHVVATGLTNEQDGDVLPAKLEMNALLTGNGRLHIRVEADPLNRVPTFKTTMELKPMELKAWNDFLRGNANADVSSGTFEVYVEANAENGRYDGYVKPFFKDLDFKSAEDENDGLGTKMKEAAIDVVTKVFDNNEQNKVATRAPFSGSFAGDNVDVWTAVETLLRNAFVEALREGFDRPFSG